ncbi:hypothetical protein RclHR1_00680037 [Rhizophagus clarus]|uniref:Uncharacterized protein n=1 Tax=Rhizophagus clarus TaxID=94130 RepID=A0A2Z6RZU9_9GLOM|nr:hypothetical protein RclHR1_00680037 [Rhizophagus clarus]
MLFLSLAGTYISDFGFEFNFGADANGFSELNVSELNVCATNFGFEFNVVTGKNDPFDATDFDLDFNVGCDFHDTGRH